MAVKSATMAVRQLASATRPGTGRARFSKRASGALIGSAQSEHLIDGVQVQPFPVYPDDRGYFLEVQRFGVGPDRAPSPRPPPKSPPR